MQCLENLPVVNSADWLDKEWISARNSYVVRLEAQRIFIIAVKILVYSIIVNVKWLAKRLCEERKLSIKRKSKGLDTVSVKYILNKLLSSSSKKELCNIAIFLKLL